MTKKTISILFAMMLLLISVAPAGASHGGSSHHPNNYAGRPLSGDTSGSEHYNKMHCQMVGYGKVDNKPVIFTANHCFNTSTGNKFDGRYIFDHNGDIFGTTPNSPSHCSASFDLCFIWLTNENRYPVNPHQVYGGRNDDGIAQWTTISTQRGSSEWDCTSTGIPSRNGYNIYAYRQNLIGQWAAPIKGTQTGNTSCDIISNYPVDTSVRWSGTPLMNCARGGTCSIIGVGWYSINGYNAFGSVRAGILAIHNYWLGYGTRTGARFCTTPSC